MKTPIRYAGGKSKAYRIINEYIPSSSYPERIISPFIGGGSLESRWASEMKIPVIGYDVFGALTNFWKVLLNNPVSLADKLATFKPTKEFYAEIKEKLICWEYTQDMLSNWHTDYYKRTPIKFSDLEAAAFYFYNHNLSYGPMYLGWISKIYQDENKWKKTINKIREYKNPLLTVKNGSFDKVIPSYSEDFLYLDPPYYLQKSEDNKMFKGMYPNCNIDVHHTGFDHESLRDLLHNHKGKFILSYNNCETIREYYDDFDQYFPVWHYSYALGEKRIGKNKKVVGNDPKKSHEILIINN
jgi:DNA adenine methylase|tara:strand:+ start:975 stop:1868 length:894 start_codon:yes stop_codon:yes gene_type:complete